MKKLRILSISFFLLFLSNSYLHSYSSDPKEFVTELVNEAISKLADKNLTNVEKEQFIEKIALENVDIDALALYTLGELRKTSEKQDVKKYQIVFEKYFLKSLTSRLTDYSSSKFEILGDDKKSANTTIVNSKVTLLEHITGKTLENKPKKDVVMEDYAKYDKDTRLLTYKVLLEKFNDKYSGLGENQKSLLKEYVNSVTNSPALKSFINKEIKTVKKEITGYSKKVEDKAVVVKLTETRDMIKPLCKKSSVNDDNVINLLNYYELVNELKTIHG